MGTTTFVIVQHGEKEPEPADPGLRAVGRRQAAAAAGALRPLRPAALYSSPLRRAVETAAVIGDALRLPVVQDPGLTERMNWTADSGLTLEEFQDEWRAATRDRQHQPRCGQSSSTAGRRLEAALRRLAEAHTGATVVCVSHGGVTTDLLRSVIGDERLLALAPAIIDHGVPGGALTHLSLTGATWHVDRVATIDHIPAGDRTGTAPTASPPGSRGARRAGR